MSGGSAAAGLLRWQRLRRSAVGGGWGLGGGEANDAGQRLYVNSGLTDYNSPHTLYISVLLLRQTPSSTRPSPIPNQKRKNGYAHFDRQTDVRTRTDVFLMNFSRTELILSVSRAKNCEESDFEVHFDVAPQKPRKNAGKLEFETEKFPKQNFPASKNPS